MKSLLVSEIQGISNNSTDTPIRATGGEIYEIQEGDIVYRVHVFRKSSDFQVFDAGSSGQVEYLVVAGGGGGGGVIGGGGGAGGFLSGTITITAQTYPIIVGSGGLGGFSWNSSVQLGFNGTNSTALGINAIGGGGGGSHGGNDTRTAGSVGGSGGGAGNMVAGAAGTVGQGFAGGTGAGASGQGNNGGGGGGAFRQGNDGINGVTGGAGGPGKTSQITGILSWYAGGGGGGTRNTFGVGGLGGRGGGGNGGTTDQTKTSTDGLANTGGGGGGGGHNGSSAGTVRSGANGGSGIVVLRYPIPSLQPIQATGGTVYEIKENGFTYKVHDFRTTGSSNFVVSNAGTDGKIEYLFVGGGGGGGGRHGGGGGGGGLIFNTMSVQPGTYPVIVGAGGSGAQTDIAGTTGQDTLFNIPGHQSVYFDRTGDYLTVAAASPAFNFGIGNFTIEAWVQSLNPAENASLIIMANYTTWAANSIYFGKHSSSPMLGRVAFWVNNFSASVQLLDDPDMLTSEWTHYAVVRNGDTWTMYRNGSAVSTATWAGNPVSVDTIWNIGGHGGGTALTWNGFISNARVVKGSARYTSNFSVPSAPLTAVTGTSLLACRSNTITDLSGNNLEITAINDAVVHNYNPFSTAAIGGGGGGSYGNAAYPNGKLGGSGGGGGHAPSLGFTGIPGQGFAGGNGLSNEGAGGGGAGGPGENGGTFGGRGGHGSQAKILDQEYYFSGGGGGGGWETPGGDGGLGGGGGGGAGSIAAGNHGKGGLGGINPGFDGVAGTTGAVSGGAGGQNTGGGGGGSGQRDSGTYVGVGGNGGSGIAVIRYPIAYPKMIKTSRKSSLYVPGTIVQCIYVRSDQRTFYAGQTSGNGTTIGDLEITIKPKSANSMLMMKWMINGEVHQDIVFLVHRNGQLISDAGYSGFNAESGNERWSGLVAGIYETAPDYDSTPNNFMLRYWIPAINTNVRTYAPAIRSSTTTAYTLHLNRTQGNASGANAYEMTFSTGVIMEIAQ